MDSVMVYLGAPDAAAFAPAPNSFVSALDFPGPAAHLCALAADPARYGSLSHLEWKRGPGPLRLPERYLRAARSSAAAGGADSVPCRLCRLVAGGGGGEGGAYLEDEGGQTAGPAVAGRRGRVTWDLNGAATVPEAVTARTDALGCDYQSPYPSESEPTWCTVLAAAPHCSACGASFCVRQAKEPLLRAPHKIHGHALARIDRPIRNDLY